MAVVLDFSEKPVEINAISTLVFAKTLCAIGLWNNKMLRVIETPLLERSDHSHRRWLFHRVLSG